MGGAIGLYMQTHPFAVEVFGAIIASAPCEGTARTVARALAHRYGTRTVIRDDMGRVVCAYDQTGPSVARVRVAS